VRIRPKLIAIVGGSGAGKSWLSQRLQETLKLPLTRVSLDDFYRDQSHLPPAGRDRVNYDHPRAIDWPVAQAVLQACRLGRKVQAPEYDFVTHTRVRKSRVLTPKPVILMDGLWLLWRPEIRRMFDLRIFLDCPARLRLNRRIERDRTTRGRDVRSIHRQFRESVAPMHKLFVAPQARWADVILRRPPDKHEIEDLAVMVREMIEKPEMSGFGRFGRKRIGQRFERALGEVGGH